jgi:hypothetical protein
MVQAILVVFLAMVYLRPKGMANAHGELSPQVSTLEKIRPISIMQAF